MRRFNEWFWKMRFAVLVPTWMAMAVLTRQASVWRSKQCQRRRVRNCSSPSANRQSLHVKSVGCFQSHRHQHGEEAQVHCEFLEKKGETVPCLIGSLKICLLMEKILKSGQETVSSSAHLVWLGHLLWLISEYGMVWGSTEWNHDLTQCFSICEAQPL